MSPFWRKFAGISYIIFESVEQLRAIVFLEYEKLKTVFKIKVLV